MNERSCAEASRNVTWGEQVMRSPSLGSGMRAETPDEQRRRQIAEAPLMANTMPAYYGPEERPAQSPWRRLMLAFLALLACYPEPRPPLPDPGPTLAQLDTMSGRIERLRENAQASVCRFEISSICDYPMIQPRVRVRNLDGTEKRRKP